METSTGGRGARERILRAAAELFYTEGINATGMDRLTTVAHVSKRTFYQHFPSKAALVEAYLDRYTTGQAPSREQALDRDDLSPRDRLLELFGQRPTDGGPIRAARSTTPRSRRRAPCPPCRPRSPGTSRTSPPASSARPGTAGARDPESLGRQLAVLLEGVTALSTSLNDSCPADDARAAARTLIDASLP